MREIRIIDLIGTPNAILHSFGMKVFEAAKSTVEQGERVSLDFHGVRNVTSAFLHASIGNLVRLSGNRDSVVIHGASGSDWTTRVDQAIRLALNPNEREIIDTELGKLFS